jgi:hypothetical protein
MLSGTADISSNLASQVIDSKMFQLESTVDDSVFGQRGLVKITGTADILNSMWCSLSSTPEIEGVVWIQKPHQLWFGWLVTQVVAHKKPTPIWNVHIECKRKVGQ